MTDLYVVVSAATGEPLWAAVTTPEEAEAMAVRAAVNFGNCNLLNGSDLAKHLTSRTEISIVGKTVQAVEVQQWAGRDTFKDTVTWERTVITFTDGTTTAFDSWDGEVYDAYRCEFNDDGEPVPYPEED